MFTYIYGIIVVICLSIVLVNTPPAINQHLFNTEYQQSVDFYNTRMQKRLSNQTNLKI